MGKIYAIDLYKDKYPKSMSLSQTSRPAFQISRRGSHRNDFLDCMQIKVNENLAII